MPASVILATTGATCSSAPSRFARSSTLSVPITGRPRSRAIALASPSSHGLAVAGGDADAGDVEEVVTAPGPEPSAPARVTLWEWEPGVGGGYEGLSKLYPSERTAFGGLTGYGASVAIGTFE